MEAESDDDDDDAVAYDDLGDDDMRTTYSCKPLSMYSCYCYCISVHRHSAG